MIYYDVTKLKGAKHHSGLMRVSQALLAEFRRQAGDRVVPVVWAAGKWHAKGGRAIELAAEDWVFTPEVFSPEERPGLVESRKNSPARWAAIYYDAIPLRFPQTTWPQSVARHPSHLKFLAGLDRVLAISEASRTELESYWGWSETPRKAGVMTIPLGADRRSETRVMNREPPAASREILAVGIVEPRKNQSLLLDVAERLHAAGEKVTFHFIGRVNPHFGEPIVARMRQLERAGVGVKYHGALDDDGVRALEARCRFSAFPSRAEGNGLPVLEAMWRGLPCVCSDIAPLLENARGGGCAVWPVDDVDAWTSGIRELLRDDAKIASLAKEAASRALPTWSDSASAVLAALK